MRFSSPSRFFSAARATARVITSLSTGLAMKSYAPERTISGRCETFGSPVIMMTGRPGARPANSRRRSMPLRPGRLMSTTATSKSACESKRATACAASEAVSGSKPARLRNSASVRRMLDSSSTIKTLGIPVRLRPARGQLYDESRELAPLALRPNRPAVLAHDAEAYGEAEARAARVPARSKERVEDAVEVFAADADAVVVELRADVRAPPALDASRGDAQESIAPPVPPLLLQRVVGVADHVDDDLAQARAVGVDARQVFGQVGLDTDAVLVELPPEERERSRDRFVERDERATVVVVPREGEEAAHDRRDAPALVDDAVQHLPLEVGAPLALVLQ